MELGIDKAVQRVFVGTGEPVTQEGLVEFRLLYEGPLASSGNSGKVSNIHAVRKALHPQLRRLWRVQRSIREWAEYRGHESNPRPDASQQERFDAGIVAVAREWPNCGFEFVPLVTEESMVRCCLDILLLRPEGEHSVVGSATPQKFILNQGDIDGQLKTFV